MVTRVLIIEVFDARYKDILSKDISHAEKDVALDQITATIDTLKCKNIES